MECFEDVRVCSGVKAEEEDEKEAEWETRECRNRETGGCEMKSVRIKDALGEEWLVKMRGMGRL